LVDSRESELSRLYSSPWIRAKRNKQTASYMQAVFGAHCAFEKDYVSCRVIIGRYKVLFSGTSASALFRPRRRSRKLRPDTAATCHPNTKDASIFETPLNLHSVLGKKRKIYSPAIERRSQRRRRTRPHTHCKGCRGHIMASLGCQWKRAEKGAGSRRMNNVIFG
jgi:hypothetical protein